MDGFALLFSIQIFFNGSSITIHFHSGKGYLILSGINSSLSEKPQEK